MKPPPPHLELQRFDKLPLYLRSARAPWRAAAGRMTFIGEKCESGEDFALTRGEFSAALAERFSEEIRQASTEQLARDRPRESARDVSLRPAMTGAGAALALFLGALFGAPETTIACSLIAASLGPLAFLGCRLLLTLFGRVGFAQAPPALSDDALPTITILAPLFREAASLRSFIQAMTDLDYPAQKLDIKLLLEAEDHETRLEAARAGAPSQFEIILIPRGAPQTKPKACNFGLALSRGDLLVIYDAEDAPETDQLRKAAAIFAACGQDTACLQARLNFYNADETWLTRQFSLEYALWFDHMLPGLAAIGAPIPLGGTSNFFRTDVLREVGGWDPFNVTEDAELGLRLARSGYKVGVLDSTTWEEAPFAENAWLKQRTRWMKGYLQTWLAHRRSGRRAKRDWLTADFFIGGAVAVALIAPMLWIAAAFGPAFGLPATPFVQWSMGAAQIALIALAAYAPMRRRMAWLSPWAVLAPIYWLMMSAAAWRGAIQFVRAPHYWEKTEHGISAASRRKQADPLRKSDATRDGI